MRTHRVGAAVIPFRAVRQGSDEYTVISVYPPSKPDRRPLGIAQTGERNPGGLVQVASEPGEICQAEAGAPFEFGAWLTTDELGRVVDAKTVDGLRIPVIAIARGAPKAAGDLLAVAIAQRGLTT